MAEMTPEEVIADRLRRIDSREIIIGFVIKLIVIAAAAFLIFSEVFLITIMKGESMNPSIRDGDLLISYRLSGSYNIGDVVTFDTGDIRVTARVAARSGDTVDITADGQLVINGYVQSENLLYPTFEVDGGARFPMKIADGCVFLLSDMRISGYDSRTFGQVSCSEIEGKVFTVLRRRGI